VNRILERILSWFDGVAPQLRRKVALIILIASLVGWPLSAVTIARHEPPVVLAISWLAITLTCLDVLCTTDVRVQDED
jgi:hypothetical protein